MKVSGLMVEGKVMVNNNGQMVQFMKENGKMINLVEK
jgi:hypothetical protein